MSNLEINALHRALQISPAYRAKYPHGLGSLSRSIESYYLRDAVRGSTNAQGAIKEITSHAKEQSLQDNDIENLRLALEGFYDSLSGMSASFVVDLARTDAPSKLMEQIDKNRQHLLSPLVQQVAQKTASDILNNYQYGDVSYDYSTKRFSTRDSRDFSIYHFHCLVQLPYIADKLRTDSKSQLINLINTVKKNKINILTMFSSRPNREDFENLFCEFFPNEVAEAEASDSKAPKEDSFKILQRVETEAIEHATNEFLLLNKRISGLETISDEVYKKVCMLAFKAYMYDNKRAPIELFRENQYDSERISNNLRTIVLKNEECRDSLKSLAVSLIACIYLDSFPYALSELGYGKDKSTKQIPTLVRALSDFVDLEKIYAEQLEKATRQLSKNYLDKRAQSQPWVFVNSENQFKALVENFRGEIRFDNHPTLKESLIDLHNTCINTSISGTIPLLVFMSKELGEATGINFNQNLRDKAKLALEKGKSRGLELLEAVGDRLSPYQDHLVTGIANPQSTISIIEVVDRLKKDEGVDLALNQQIQLRLLADVKETITSYKKGNSYSNDELSKHTTLLLGSQKDQIEAIVVKEFDERLTQARVDCTALLDEDFLKALGVEGLNKERIVRQVKDLDLKVGRAFTSLVRKGEIIAALKLKNTLSPTLNLDKHLRVITGIQGITCSDLDSYNGFLIYKTNLSVVSRLAKLYGSMNERFYKDLVLKVISDQKKLGYLEEIESYHTEVASPKDKEEKFLNFFIDFKNKYPENYNILLRQITSQCKRSDKKIDLALEGERVCAYIDSFSTDSSFDLEEYYRFKNLDQV